MASPREVDEFSITSEVIESFRNCDNPRLKQILEATTRAVHDLVRELQLTTAEWEYAIDFLTRVGHMCTDRRQEFILLSDTLGVSMLVDAINNRVPEGATRSTVLGPFFVEGAPVVANGANIDIGGDGGELMYAEALVTDMQGRPIADATVDVWHSDEEGNYDVQYGADAPLTRRAQLHTDAQGRSWFWSSLPVKYPIPHDGPVGQMLVATKRHPFRPAHLHFMIDAPGYKRLVTHIFVEESDYLDSDAVFGVKKSLIDEFPRQPAGKGPDGRQTETPYRLLRWHFKLPRMEELPAKAA